MNWQKMCSKHYFLAYTIVGLKFKKTFTSIYVGWMVVYTSNHRTARSEVQGHQWLHKVQD